MHPPPGQVGITWTAALLLTLHTFVWSVPGVIGGDSTMDGTLPFGRQLQLPTPANPFALIHLPKYAWVHVALSSWAAYGWKM